MSRKPQAEPSITLSDADIGSERVVTRRSLLGGLGVGLAAATGAIVATTGAADAKKKAKKKAASKKPAPDTKKPAQEETDAD